MEKQLLLEVTTSNTESLTTKEQKEGYDELMALISEMNVVEIEPYLDEDLNSESSTHRNNRKYHSLASLRDLFKAYKAGGDTELMVEFGTCNNGCVRSCPVVNLCGNKTGRNFSFSIDKEGDKIVSLHNCLAFLGKDLVPRKADLELAWNFTNFENDNWGDADADRKAGSLEILKEFMQTMIEDNIKKK